MKTQAVRRSSCGRQSLHKQLREAVQRRSQAAAVGQCALASAALAQQLGFVVGTGFPRALLAVSVLRRPATTRHEEP